MTKQSFVDLVVTELRNKLNGPGYDVSLTSTLKENDSEMNAIAVLSDEKIIPLIKTEQLYKDFLRGMTIDDIVENLVHMILEGSYPDVDGLVESIEDFESVKNYIFASVVNTKFNELWLLNRPHHDVADLSIIYHIVIENGKDHIMRAPITDEIFDGWDITAKSLYKTAISNTNKIHPPVVAPIEQTIANLFEFNANIPTLNSDDNSTGMIVVSNDMCMYGAIHMLNTGLLADISDTLNSKQLLILPSSVHEVLVCSAESISVEAANKMVREVNQMLEPRDVLSDHAYIYDVDMNMIY